MSQPTLETGTVQTLELTAQFEEIVQQNIDIEKFEAVAEHDASIQRLVERYGDNPGTCPYIKSMGAAGVELVQKLAAAESNPERGPTMRALMEAKKRQTQVSDVTAEKPQPTKTTNIPEAKVAEYTSDEKSNITVPRVIARETVVAHEHAARLIEAAISKKDASATKVVIPANAPVKPVRQRQAIVTVPRTEAAKLQHADVDARGVLEIESAHQTQSMPEENSGAQTAVAIEPILRINTAGSVRRQTVETIEHEPLPAINIAETLEDQITQNTVTQIPRSSELSDVVNEQPFVDVMADFEREDGADPTLMPIEDEAFDFEALLAESCLEGYVPDATKNMFVENPAETILADLNVDTELIMAETDRELAVEEAFDVVVANDVLGEEIIPKESITPVALQEELGNYIQLLEPNKAKTAQETIAEQVQAIQDVRELVEPNTEEIIATTEEVKQQLTELLEILGLDCSEQAVMQIMQTLLSPEILEELNQEKQLMINQLNYMGTREYKSNSIISMLVCLLQMTKGKVEPHLRIGRYALSFSLAYEMKQLYR